MPILRSREKTYYFAHIPKCGGTSVESYLEAAFGTLFLKDALFYQRPEHERWGKISPQHVLWGQVEHMFPRDGFDASFAIVRHPMKRIVSAYNSFVADGVIKWQGFSEWLDSVTSNNVPAPFLFDQHACRQVDFTPPDTRWFKLEDGHTSFLEYARVELGADPKLEIPYLNRTNASKTDFQTRKMSQSEADRIHDIYEADFEAFGYPHESALPDLYMPKEKRPFGVRTALRQIGLLPARPATGQYGS